MPPIFSFAGRTTRSGYAVLGVALLIVMTTFHVAGVFSLGLAALDAEGLPRGHLGGEIITVGQGLVAYLAAAGTVRRLRDMGWSIPLGVTGLVGAVLVLGAPLVALEQAVNYIDPTSGLARLSYAPLFVLLLWPSAPTAPEPEVRDVNPPEPPPSFGRRAA